MTPSTRSTRALHALPLALFLGLAVLAGFIPATAHAQSAAAWSKRGISAEARDNYDEAYEDYRQAHLKRPKDLAYKTRFEHIKFLAASAHIDRGRVLKAANDLAGALAEFKRALQMDPSSQTAQQEIDLLQQASQAIPSTPAEQEQMAGQKKTIAELNTVAGPIELKPVSNDPITIHAVEDVKNIYQAIGKIAGLNILFDPDYTSKRIPVDLTNTNLSDALRIVGTLAGTFYKPVTSNTIFVAQNTRTKHTDLDQEAVQTFYLTNASQANDANEIQTAIRNLLDPSTKIYLVPSQNAIVMRATPDQLLLAQKLINDLDHTRSEVVVDVAVLEVSKNWERKLGISLPQSIQLTPQASPTSTTTTTTTTTGSTFTLNSLAHLNATNFAVTLGGGELDALLNDSDTRVLQNPRIRATDGQPATLKIGSKIPIATGSYSSGVSTGTVSLGVQTQFTYLDVGVNINMTPTVHYDHEIGLKLKIEVSTESGTTTISGVTEPIISQRSIEQVIQLKEGEPSVLAGILTKQDGSALTGTPGLAQIPLLKYIFGSTDKTVQDDEIVFLLIPHIVRESILTQLNTRAIDTGTGQSIELRQVADAVPAPALLQPVVERPIGSGTTAAAAAASIVGQIAQQANPRQPGQTLSGQPLPGPQPPVAPVTFNIQPPSSNQSVGSTFQVAVSLANGTDIYSVPLQLQFNPAVLDLVNVDAGDFLGRDGQAVSLVHRDEGNGLVTISTSRPPGVAGVSGQGSLCVLTFKAKAAGDSNLSLVKVGARNSTQASLPATGSQAVVHVK